MADHLDPDLAARLRAESEATKDKPYPEGTVKKPDGAPCGRDRFSPSARAHLASIVVAGDRRRGRPTPKWIRDLAESGTDSHTDSR